MLTRVRLASVLACERVNPGRTRVRPGLTGPCERGSIHTGVKHLKVVDITTLVSVCQTLDIGRLLGQCFAQTSNQGQRFAHNNALSILCGDGLAPRPYCVYTCERICEKVTPEGSEASARQSRDDALLCSITSKPCGAAPILCTVDNKAVIIIKGSFDVNGKMATDIISYGYAAIVLAGGVVGYVKAGKGP